MMDLTTLPKSYLAKHGAETVAAALGKDVRIVQRWLMGHLPPLTDLQKLIEFDPSLASTSVAMDLIGDSPAPATLPEQEPTQYDWPAAGKIAILMPTNRGCHEGVLKAFASVFDRDKMQFLHPGRDMSLLRARNLLANDAVAAGCTKVVWWDDDTVPPHGDVVYHRSISNNPRFPENYIKLHPIGRLMQAKKTLVGAVYFSRRRGGRAQYHGAFVTRTADELDHKGPHNHVTEERWVGMGFTLVDRQVFLDIQKSQPELEIQDNVLAKQLGYRWRFFNPLSVIGPDSEHSEDVAFCVRAGRAGHKCYVDHAVSCVHVGPHGFSYENTAAQV